MKKQYLFLLPLLLFTFGLSAQSIEIPLDFQEKLDQSGMQLLFPGDMGYKSLKCPKNDFHTCDFAIYSRQEDLEIRYAITLYDEEEPTTTVPNVLGTRAALTTSSNDEEAVMTALKFDKNYLEQVFQADWAAAWYFTPKKGFSARQHCQLLVLHKEGVATTFIYFLFDDPNNTAVDYRFVAAKFLE